MVVAEALAKIREIREKETFLLYVPPQQNLSVRFLEMILSSTSFQNLDLKYFVDFDYANIIEHNINMLYEFTKDGEK